MAKITFILGGARSGKSSYAEGIALDSKRKKIYVATAAVLDKEMEERIEKHRLQRGDDWDLVETPLDIAKQIKSSDYENSVILVDCLTLWLSNLLHNEMNITEQINILIESLKSTQADMVLVSNEVGLGIVPENALARQFRDYAGILHQKVAEIADEVVLVVAGIPMKIKGQ